MKRIVITTLGLAVAVALWGSVRAEEAKDAKEPAGKKLFVENKCNSCHSIDAAGIEKKKAETAAAATGEKKEAAAAEKTTTTVPAHKAPDLSSVGLDQTSEWMGKFLKKEVATKEGKKHMKLWKGTDADLTTLTAWLGEQKAEKKDVKATDEKAETKPADDAVKAAETKAPETKAPETETK